MKYIKTYEALSIKQYKPYHKEAQKVNYKERYKDIFQKYKEKYEGDRNAFRIYIPLIREKKKSQTQYDVEQCLKTLGIDITNAEVFDYVWGKAKFPGSKNWTGIGKMLSKKPEWAKTLKAFAEDETRTLRGKDSDLEVCISRHPYDVVGSDTDRPWINCMTLTHYNRFKKEWQSKGGSVSFLKHDVRQGSLTAYLIKNTDRNLQAPLANIGIKPYLNEDDSKDIVLVPDNRMYGMRNLDFSMTVFNWCDEVNGDKIGYYKIAKNLHMDNFHREEGMIGADIKKAREDMEEFDYFDPRKNYARKHLPPDPWKDKKLESVNNQEPKYNVDDWVEVGYAVADWKPNVALKKGDYVIISSFDLGVINELMILDEDPQLNNDGFTVVAQNPFNQRTMLNTFYDYEIVKKLTPEEAEFQMNLKKYNL